MLRRREFIASALAAAVIDIPRAMAAEESLRVFWWGNPDRAKRTGEVIKQFEAATPDAKFVGQVATSDYWVKLATMVAGRNVPDVFALEPVTFADYSRRGIFDGIGIRLPTICVRPGAPNKAASGFFSNILREPLAGKPAVLPVSDSVRHWFASPRAAVGFFVHAARIDTAEVGPRRNLTMPGLSALVSEEIEALRRVAGEKAVKLIRDVPDSKIIGMVDGWPKNFAARRAEALGFKAEKSFDEIIRIHVEDELGGKIGG